MSSGTSKSIHAIRIAQKNNMLLSSNKSNSLRKLDGIARRILSPSTTTARNINSSRQNIVNTNSRRTISSICNRALINSSFNQNNTSDGLNLTSVSAVTALLTAAIYQEYNKSNVQCDSVSQVGLTPATNPLFSKKKSDKNHQPRNVMLHRMRSTRARHLGEKYKVDWKTCLGEGAYAQVFPGKTERGEKVCNILSN